MTSRFTRLYDEYLKKTPRQSRSRSVVDAILAATLERLSREGDEDDIAVQQIASRAGVGIGSLYDYFRDRNSLLAGAVAKVTEDNLRRFEAVLAGTENLPLREAIGVLVDHALETYAADKRVARSVLRVANAARLMPLLALSQDAFAATLAEALRKRSDVKEGDLRAMTFAATHAMMGVIHSLVWQDDPALPMGAIRDELVELMYSRFARERAPHGNEISSV